MDSYETCWTTSYGKFTVPSNFLEGLGEISLKNKYEPSMNIGLHENNGQIELRNIL